MATIQALALLLFFSTGHASVEPSDCWKRNPHGGELTGKDLPYQTGNTPQRLDVYLPKGQTKPHPTVIFIHGGCFTGGAKEDPGESLPEIQRLLGAGYAVVSVEYRRADPGNPDPNRRHPYPAAWNDVADAALWVKLSSGGGRFGLDPKRVATFGYSAGGTLANYLATRPITPSPKAWPGAAASPRLPAVDLYGRTDFTLGGTGPHANGVDGDCAEQFLGKSRSSASLPAFREASVVPDNLSAPIQIVHGTVDAAVAPIHSRLLYQRLQKIPSIRSRSGLLLIEGGAHMLPDPEHRNQAWRAACSFLDKEIGPPAREHEKSAAEKSDPDPMAPAQEQRSKKGL